VSSEDPPTPVPTRPDISPHVALRDIARFLGTSVSDGEGVTVTGISQSTVSMRAGDLFAAVPGTRTHGARFAAEVERAGAVAILTDRGTVALRDRHIWLTALLVAVGLVPIAILTVKFGGANVQVGKPQSQPRRRLQEVARGRARIRLRAGGLMSAVASSTVVMSPALRMR